MTEATVLLTLPLRGVVLTDTSSNPPGWLVEELRRVIAARRQAIVDTSAEGQLQQELQLLSVERQAWSRGYVELQRITAQSDASLAGVLDELRAVAVELAHAIASKLVFQKIASNSFPVDRLVSEVLGRLSNREPATVRLHPDDLAVLNKDKLVGVAGTIDSEREVRLVADASLARGDCKAVAGEITVIYELRRQIEEIRAELLSTVSGHAEPGH